MKKSLWTRLLSLLLAVVLCVELLPAVGSAVSPSEDLEHTVEGTVEEPAEVAFEEASLRGERVKHFRMGDGSYVAVQYDVPVHHQDADGRWQDIDNTLEPVGQTYAVEDGSVAFAASLNGDAVFTADADEHRVQLFLDGDPDVLPSHDATLAAPEPTEAVALPEVTEETKEAAEEPAEETETAASEEEPAAEMMVETGAAAELEPAGPARSYHAAEAVVQEPFSLRSDDPFVPEKLSSSLLYPDVYDGVDLAYTLYGETIKETILLNKAQASYLFSFVLQTGDLTAEMQEDGSVLLLDEAGSPVYAIPAPYMLDAGGTYSDAVRYTLEELDRGSYRLLVDADAAWIEEEAQFPVAIDPTIVKISQSGSLSWAYVFSGRPDTSFPESTQSKPHAPSLRASPRAATLSSATILSAPQGRSMYRLHSPAALRNRLHYAGRRGRRDRTGYNHQRGFDSCRRFGGHRWRQAFHPARTGNPHEGHRAERALRGSLGRARRHAFAWQGRRARERRLHANRRLVCSGRARWRARRPRR